MSRRRIVVTLLVVGAVAGIVLAVVFKPWLLFVDVRVDDALPSVPTATAATGPTPTTTSTPEPAGPVVLATGSFISHAHETSGNVSIVEDASGKRVLAIENLVSTSGPDVHVWLSASDAAGGASAGSAAFVDLGVIKGNLGNQVYDIPAEVDLSQFQSVNLWCVQFSVAFGAAQLTG